MLKIVVCAPAQSTSNYDVYKGYAHAFRMLGHFVTEIPYLKLFRRWSEYYRFFHIVEGVESVQFDKEDIIRTASMDLVLSIMECVPDIVVIIDGTNIHQDAWAWMRRLGLNTVMVGTESPYQDNAVKKISQYAEQAYVNDAASAKKLSLPYLPTAYNTNVHYPMYVPETMRHDVVFVGSGFKEREAVLSSIDWDGIDLEFYGHYQIDHDHKLAPYYKDAQIKNEQAAILYAGAKISLNLNRTSIDYDGEMQITESKSLSPRAYEIPACGGFMISEYRPEIEEIFGDTVPTFRTPEELQVLIEYWLPRNDKRAELADAAREIVKPHSYTERAKVILSRTNVNV